MKTGRIRHACAWLACIGLMAACSGGSAPAGGKVSADAPLEPEPAFDFVSTLRPSMDVQHTLRLMLRAGGLDVEGAGNDAPIYADIEFFPVVEAQPLVDMTRRWQRSSDYVADIEAIDFDSQFAFVVAHPALTASMPMGSSSTPASPGIYLSQPKVSYGDGGIDILMDASRIGGNADPLALAFASSWNAKVYVLDRRGADTLRVRLYDDTYTFSLSPVEPEAGPADAAAVDAASGPAPTGEAGAPEEMPPMDIASP